MSRRHKPKEKLPPFIPITHLMLESSAYKKLSGNAAKLLPYFIRACVRCCKGKPDNSIQFDFTYGEALKIGFARNTFSRVMMQLVEHGFVDLVEIGGLRGAGHSNSKYCLSDRWAVWGGWVGRNSFRKRPRSDQEEWHIYVPFNFGYTGKPKKCSYKFNFGEGQAIQCTHF